VQPGREAHFEQVYGPDGEWARFFRRGEGYLRTELLRDKETANRYLTVDLWRSREDYERFRQQHAEEYRRIDESCEHMTQQETAIGSFARLA
jgi:heme-degrading monooxygenase HmoA